jgi:ubiquinone/menaquinone biosynthesis C-methylase UbiE
MAQAAQETGDTGQAAVTATPDQDFYDAETEYFNDPAFMSRHLPLLESYVAGYRPKLAALAHGERRLRTLELGAGSCSTSLLLSREPWAGAMHCVDISAKRMRAAAAATSKQIGGRLELLTFSEGDFSFPLPLEDSQFDVVIFDAALHHSRNMWLTLRECHRVLAAGGLLIAQREQYVARWTYGFALNRLLRSREVRSGVSENAYLKEQYDYYLRATGFRPDFQAVAPGRLRWLSPLNGLVFSKWSIIAERRAEAPVLD